MNDGGLVMGSVGDITLLCMYLINVVVQWTWEDVYLQSTGMYCMYLYLPALGSL